jgi:hypothetical protein
MPRLAGPACGPPRLPVPSGIPVRQWKAARQTSLDRAEALNVRSDWQRPLWRRVGSHAMTTNPGGRWSAGSRLTGTSTTLTAGSRQMGTVIACCEVAQSGADGVRTEPNVVRTLCVSDPIGSISEYRRLVTIQRAGVMATTGRVRRVTIVSLTLHPEEGAEGDDETVACAGIRLGHRHCRRRGHRHTARRSCWVWRRPVVLRLANQKRG